MDSLYSGHAGNSFVLKASFKSYAEMVAAFRLGAEYKDVWYGEYCILDTTNKNDKDNGKIYKRGLNYQDSKTGGALYLGQIVGPSSGTPYFQLDTIESVAKHTKGTLEKNEYIRYPVGKDSQGKYICSDGSDKKEIATFNFDKNIEQGLVPGKYVENDQIKYNDHIKYTWVNIRKDNADADSWFYVGWSTPYTVIDYSVHTTSPYDENGNILSEISSIERIDTEEHPFYEKWNLGIPKGVKGDSVRNLKVITPTEENKNTIYDIQNVHMDEITGEITLGEPGYEGLEDDILNARKILVFEYYCYDKKLNPDAIIIYLGDFNVIKNITLDDYGTLTIEYTHDSNDIFDKKIKWVKSVTLTNGNGNQGGHFSIAFNNGTPSYETDLTWIKDIQINKTDGTVTYTYAGTNNGRLPSDGIVTVPNLIKWVKDINLDSDSGHFEVNFNDNTQYENTLEWVKDITINEANGDITFNQTTGDRLSSAKLKILDGAEISKDGIITLHFNTGATLTLKNINSNTNFQIKNIENIVLQTGILDDKRIQIKYNTDKSFSPIGDPINYVQHMVVRPSDYHLFVLFNDPKHRAKTSDLNSEGKDANGYSWVGNDTIRAFDSSIPNYGAEIYWRDYGAIKDQSGILIGFNLTAKEVEDAGFDPALAGNPTDGTGVNGYLQSKYPSGLTGEQNVAGGPATKAKIVTYTPPSIEEGLDKQDKEFYAYDYVSYKWFYLGKIGDTGDRDVKLLSTEEINAGNLQTLNTQGVLLKRMPTNFSDRAIPKFWDREYVNWATIVKG